jgi:hypothetical protein
MRMAGSIRNLPDARRNMRNDLSRAAYWITFILERCQFPNRDALAAHFANAEIVKLCECEWPAVSH